MKTLILTAGKIDYTRLPFGMHQSNATIPVNGKPVISWILDDLIQKGFSEIGVVIRAENNILKQLLQKHYSKRIKLQIVTVFNPESILTSLQAGLNATLNDDEGIQVILGDTLLYDSFDGLTNTLLVSTVKASQHWCTVQTDEKGNLLNLIDKREFAGTSHLALCGYYQFGSMILLNECIENSIQQGAKELSHTLLTYHRQKPLTLKQADTWFDFGHLETFIQSKKSLLRPRHFNQLTIDPLLNTITKKSDKSDKLEDELNWYKMLPAPLQTLTPRIITQYNEANTVSITQEFYGYPSLSELYIYGDLSTPVWESIIDYLFQIHGLFKQYEKEANPQHLITMYQTKTHERIEQLLVQHLCWSELWNKTHIVINGIQYENIPSCLQKLHPAITKLTQLSHFHILHGDYCLSNILYDLNNQIVRLIDPRGSFGEKGVYGDARYDIAKLRHSIVGQYDYIVNDLFQLNYQDSTFEYQLFEDEKNKPLATYFDKCIQQNNYDVSDITLIEGLLFLSMIPYHADYIERQQMMYIQSVIILNELLVNNNK